MKYKEHDAAKLLQIAIGTSLILALAYLLIYSTDGFPDEAARLGQLGDFFGGILNPTVSVLTLFVAISVWRLQRDELELTRSELEQTKLAMEEQAKTAEQQRQEQRFFDLLNVYYRTVDVVLYTHVSLKNREHIYQDYKGKAAMTAWLGNASSLFHFALNRGEAVPGKGYDQSATEIQNMDRMIHQWHANDALTHFDSYFRVVQHLLTEAGELLGDQHQRYVALFRSQLTRTEVVLLSYHLWLDPDGQHLAPLASTYALLQNLPLGDLRTEIQNDLDAELFKSAHM